MGPLLCGSCGGMQRDPLWFEKTMNDSVGKPIDAPYKNQRFNYMTVLSDVDDLLVVEDHMPNGCSYVLNIRRPSMILESWKYTSDPKLCNHNLDIRSH
jgi:hypothetical protein